jgi:lipooligosaccharide transport system permease protein
MVTTLTIPRLIARTDGSAVRVSAVTGRNLYALRHSAYWLVVISGFFEPVLYLGSIGVGVGGLVHGFTLADGTVVSYAAFVAPAMLAASAMNGALAESLYNFFARLRWVKLYDAMVATPLRPLEIALGEMGWALLRGFLYSLVFLGLMIGLGLTSAGWAFLALLASLLVGVAFGAVGLAIGTMMRTWQDFDYLFVIQFGLFLFSGTFAPVQAYPLVLRVIIECTPLYHAVELIRDLTTGRVDWGSLTHVAYLVGLSTLGLYLASKRMTRLLCK